MTRSGASIPTTTFGDRGNGATISIAEGVPPHAFAGALQVAHGRASRKRQEQEPPTLRRRGFRFRGMRRHRAELLEACGPGRRPWAFWKLERRFRSRPAGELGELRAIAQLNLYRDAREAEHVERRLRELGRARNAGRRMVAAVKRAGRPKPTLHLHLHLHLHNPPQLARLAGRRVKGVRAELTDFR